MTERDIHVDDVTLAFGAVRALDGITVSIPTGSIHAIIGPNGAGKTTLLNVLSGVYPIDSGSVMYDGTRIDDLRPHEVVRRGICRTYQNIVLGHTTVEDAILLGRHHVTRTGLIGATLRTRRSRREERSSIEQVKDLASTLQISHLLSRRAADLSYGDQKRVELARALAAEPSVLLLDEPVAGMNSAEKQEMAALIKQVHVDHELTVVLVEHDMTMVTSLAHRCTVLDFGRVIADGAPAEVVRDPEVIRAYLGDEFATTDSIKTDLEALS